MGIVKGCFNKKCVANQKKITYKKADEYCSKCGRKLYYVCRGKECYTQLPDDSEKYCARCLADKQDSKHKALKKAGKIGGVVATIGIVLSTGKGLVKVILKK